MVYKIKSFAKFITLFFVLFVVLALFLMLYNVLPGAAGGIESEELVQLAKNLTVHVFYFSLFNALLISLFLYGFLIVDSEYRRSISIKIMPLVFAFLIGFLVFLVFKPTEESVFLELEPDARLFINQGEFFSYNEDFPSIISKEEFEACLEKASRKERKIFSSCYIYNAFSGFYNLKTSADPFKRDIVKNMFLQARVMNETKIFVSKLHKNKLENVIISKNNKTIFIPELKVHTINDELRTEHIPELGKPLVFYSRASLAVSRNESFFFSKIVQNNQILMKIVLGKKLFASLLVWFTMIYFCLTLSSFFYFKNFPFLSLLFNFLILYFFLTHFQDLHYFFTWIFGKILPDSLEKFSYLIICLLVIIPLFLYNFLYYFLHKLGGKENE